MGFRAGIGAVARLLNNGMKSTQKFDGKTFEIAQPSGVCCSGGCGGCELFEYKKKNNIPIQNPRTKFYESFYTVTPEVLSASSHHCNSQAGLQPPSGGVVCAGTGQTTSEVVDISDANGKKPAE